VSEQLETPPPAPDDADAARAAPEPDADEGTEAGKIAPATPAEPDEPAPAPEPPAEPDEPAPEPPAEQPQGVSPEQWEARFKKAEKARDTYMNAVSRIFEEDVTQLDVCPLCVSNVLGFVLHDQAGQVPADVTNATMRFLGIVREVEYPQSPDHRTCSTCEGLGKVTTGSRVPNRESETCPTCEGYGYIGPKGVAQNGGAAPRVNVEQAGAALADFEERAVDDFGEPRILPDGRPNPNFGKWPQYKVLIEPWGVTAGLTAQDAPANA
jgi:hypothetical protein